MQTPKPNNEASPNTPEIQKMLPPPATDQARIDAEIVLRFGGIEDETDRHLAIAAARFVQSPTSNLAEIDDHMQNMSEVSMSYMMAGSEAPPEVDALHCNILKLYCQHQIDTAEAELKNAPRDAEALDLAMRMALDSAQNLAKGYKIRSYLQEVQILQAKIAEGIGD